MSESELFQLRRNDFNQDLCLSLTSILASSSLCDVTLVCGDGHLSAHKVILAASSTFFSSIFNINHHSHPLIFLRGIKVVHMRALLDYIYSGSATVKEENLSSFLAVAEDLLIEGLMKKNSASINKLEGKVEESAGESKTALINFKTLLGINPVSLMKNDAGMKISTVKMETETETTVNHPGSTSSNVSDVMNVKETSQKEVSLSQDLITED